MDLDLSGKRALVCGSTQGIGRAAAEELALLGAEIILLARDPARLESVRASLPRPRGQAHTCVVADMADPVQVADAGAQVAQAGSQAARGDVHILIHNTGGPTPGPIAPASPEQFESAFRAHVVSAQLLAQALVPGMKRAGYGRILTVISTSVKQPIPGLGVSNTIRGAMASWAKTLAGELGPFGITVNNVLPGFTSTERLTALITGRAKAGNTSEESIAEELRASIPLRRFAEAREVGAALAFLASPAAGYISGINLPVDGGRLQTL